MRLRADENTAGHGADDDGDHAARSGARNQPMKAGLVEQAFLAEIRSDFAHIGRMDITPAMLRAARSAEFAYYQQNRLVGARFLPIPEGQLVAILEAAIGAIGEDMPPEAAEAPARDGGEGEVYDEIPTEKRPAIVRARKPRSRR